MIFTNEFKNKDVVVSAGEIISSELGDVVQALFDGGAKSTTMSTYSTNPLDETSDEVKVVISTFINNRVYTATIGDYIVWEETAFGEVVYLVPKDVFEREYELNI